MIMDIKQYELDNYYKEIHNKKYERRIINSNRNVIIFTIFVITGMLLYFLSSIFFTEVISIIWISYLVISAFFIPIIIIEINNNSFKKLDIYSKQLYILHLTNKRIKRYIQETRDLKKNQIIVLLNEYCLLLEKVINEYKKINIFGISREEMELRAILNCFKNKLIPIFKDGENYNTTAIIHPLILYTLFSFD